MTTATTGPAIRIRRVRHMEMWAPVYLAPEPITRKPMTLTNYPLGNARHQLNVYARMMGELGLKDPTDAIELIDKARAVMQEARQTASEVGAEATGSDAVDLASQQVAARVTGAEIRSQIIHNAREEAVVLCREAARALEAAGDDLVTELLAPEVEKIIAAGDTSSAAEDRFESLHKLAKALRGWALPKAGSSHLNYRFARPDEVHTWVLNGSRRVRELYRSGTPEQPRIYLSPVDGAPRVTMRDVIENADTWKPGLYTAAQVHEHAAEWETL